MVSFLPLALVWFSLLLWGRGFAVQQGEQRAERGILELSGNIDAALGGFLALARSLADDPIVQESIRGSQAEWTPDQELALYSALYRGIGSHLHTIDITLTSMDGMQRHTTGVLAEDYDFRNYQNRLGIPDGVLSGNPGYSLGIRQGAGLSIWVGLPGGVLILDIHHAALNSYVDSSPFRDLYLVDRRGFAIFDLLRPQQITGFSDEPQLGIVFSPEVMRQPEADLLVHRRDLEAGRISLVGLTDLAPAFQSLSELLAVGLWLMVAAGILTVIISIRISRSISRPIHRIVTAMAGGNQGPKRIQELRVGTNTAGVETPRDELDYLMVHYNRMVGTIDQLIVQIRQEERALREAERRALQAWVNPHFLYNTLGSIKSMAKLGQGQVVADMITELGKILRFAITDTGGMVTVQQSMAQIRSYLRIQKMRYQDRIVFSEYVDARLLELLVPKLLIQPLVENAILHGVEATPEPVEISVRVEVAGPEEESVQIIVENTTPPALGPVREAAPEQDTEAGAGMGFENVRRRVQAVYGDAGRVEFFRGDLRTQARIIIPRRANLQPTEEGNG